MIMPSPYQGLSPGVGAYRRKFRVYGTTLIERIAGYGPGGISARRAGRQDPAVQEHMMALLDERTGQEFTSTGVVYGVADPAVTGSPVAGVSA
jgi:hypothetical protein